MEFKIGGIQLNYAAKFYWSNLCFIVSSIFVELGGGVDDVPRWRREGAYVELGFR